MKIKVQQATSSRDPQESIKDMTALFCYYFQQYTYSQALNLPIKTMKRMLKAAQKAQARDYLELVQIARVAQADKPAPYNSLISRYKEQANG